MLYLIVLEVRPEQNFIVYHIDYTRSLLQNHNKYLYFQDMLKSNIRYKASFLLQQLLGEGWNMVGQSQNEKSIYYTLTNDTLDIDDMSSSTDSLQEAKQPVSAE